MSTRLVDVPTTVIMPPSIAAKESGIRNFEAESPDRSAQSFTYGMRKATIGVLLIIDDTPADDTMIPRRKRFGLSVSVNSPANRRGPKIVRTPAVTMISRKMTMISGLANPLSASSGVRMPVSKNATTQMKKENAGLNHSRYRATMRKTTAARTKKVLKCSGIEMLKLPGIRIFGHPFVCANHSMTCAGGARRPHRDSTAEARG